MTDCSAGRPLSVLMLLANPDGRGGTQRQAHLLIPALEARGISVVLVRRAYGLVAPQERRTGRGRTVWLPALRWLPGWSFLASFLLWAMLHRGRYQVIHAHNTSLGVVAGCVGWILHIPVVAKVTEMKHVDRLRRASALERLRAWVLSRGARLIALSSAMRSELVRSGMAPDRIELIPNGVAPASEVSEDERTTLRAHWLAGSCDTVVLFVGRLTERKRVALLLHAWAAMARPARSVLLIVGDGRLRPALEAAADRLRLGDSIRFLGAQDDVTPFYRMADVFVLPSASEGMSNALLEAMAAGLPAVVSPIAAHREIIQDGQSGFLVDWTDRVASGRLLEHVLGDPGLRQRVGAAARRRADSFTMAAVADTYCRLYRRLVDGDAPRHRLTDAGLLSDARHTRSRSR